MTNEKTVAPHPSAALTPSPQGEGFTDEAFETINRQRAEIERLNKIVSSYEKNIDFKAEYISKILDGKTNYDRLRNMSIPELAEFLDDMQTDALFLEGTIKDLKYPVEWEEWLRAEVAKDE